ncbi:MAG: hypothetical protein ACRESX_01975 [Gammaproteobacteria bacterium]
MLTVLFQHPLHVRQCAVGHNPRKQSFVVRQRLARRFPPNKAPRNVLDGFHGFKPAGGICFKADSWVLLSVLSEGRRAVANGRKAATFTLLTACSKTRRA